MKLQLTKGYEAVVDDDFIASGRRFCVAEQRLKSGNYRALAVGNLKYPDGKWRLVQLGWFALDKLPWEHRGLMLDHINRDPLDNRRENLRLVTAKENSNNREQVPPGKGISFDKKRAKWIAYLLTREVPQNQRQKFLGRFETRAEAEAAVAKARGG